MTFRFLTVRAIDICNYGLAVLMLYEYILTVDDELELVWRRRISLSSWLLFANRFTLIFVVTAWVVRNANTSVKHFTFSD